MRKKIFLSLNLIAIMVLILSSAIATAFLQKHFNKEREDQLYIELEFVADAVNEIGMDYLEYVENPIYRFTVVEKDGSVVFDTKADPGQMDNHGDREEIREAFATGNGTSARYSATLMEKTFNEAVKLEDGKVLRVSVSQISFGGAFLQLIPMLFLLTGLVFFFSLIISRQVAVKITEPLWNLDLEHPGENNTYEELSPVLTKIRKQHSQLEQQMKELKQKNDEFSQILSSMNEGLILLDQQGCVITMNDSAKKIFASEKNPEGKDFIYIDRSPEWSQGIEDARNNLVSQITLSKMGREYEFSISPVQSEGICLGTLILGFDITEKAFAERNRQEFTANVSHELKTPLQTIMGSAELLECGLVREEDRKKFIGNIRKEAECLMNLINDIIQLSRLDEKAEVIKEKVDLSEVAEEVKKTLAWPAEKKKVSMSFVCDSVIITGVRRYLYEILYNLCDNGIRYNKEGGRVEICIRKVRDGALIRISDTGIGIPVEHQSRIFERFYRVDKSHSRETGGTGLGLSIVKRSVMLHGGKIELKSKAGKGTVIRIILPE